MADVPPAARYAEHPLHPALRGPVAAAWSVTLDAAAAPLEHRVLPDGCIDIVLTATAPPVVVGPTTGPLLVAMTPGTAVRGLRFRPGAAPALLGVGADALRDRTVPLAELLGPGHRGGEPLALAAVQALLVRRLLAGPAADDPLVAAAVAMLTAAPGTEVAALARAVALSERQLRRRFHAAVGYGPKRLARVLRLQRLLAESRRDPAALGVELALAAGYADEAHMGREARELAGTAAQALLAERGRSVQAPSPAGVQAA